MVLHSFGQEVRPWSDYARSIHAELRRQSPWPLDIVDYSLVSARSSDENSERPFVEYLRAQFSGHSPDLIVSVGAPAASFVQRYRPQLFAMTPMVLSVVEQRRVDYSALTQNDTVVPVHIDYPAALENILRVLPDTTNVFVVVGRSPIEQFWGDEIRKAATPYDGLVDFTFWNDLSFEDILNESKQLPPHSAIFWELMIVDAAGVVHDGDDAFLRLHAVSNAPIFGYYEPNIGQGVVGGPYNGISDSSRVTAAIAVRILRGERASDIRIPALDFASPKFDWREMQRWGISENLLPPGSEVLFRDLTAWQRYSWQIASVAAALLLQAGLITVLLRERRQRHVAEMQSRQRMVELAHVNRFSTAGEMTGLIAHEINQPLGSILANAEAAQIILRTPSPNLSQLSEIVGDILRDDQRASEVIRRIRALLKKAPFELNDIDLDDLVRETVVFISTLAQGRKIELRSLIAADPLPIRGDRVQLQQAILNLVVNGIDAMRDMPIESRIISIETARDEKFAELTVSDHGPGIPEEKLKQVFDPFFTTKAEGMGMGLSITRTIVEAHSGQILARNQPEGGASFQIRLPLR
jgi:signal transduction histidine kinase